MENLMVKEFEGTGVEIILNEKEEPLFELYSTGMALGYVRPNPTGKLYARKDRIDNILEVAEIKPCVQGGHNYLTEEMVYDFMFEAKTEKCKSFRKWLSNEVLPSIRKHGAYMTDKTIEELANNPDLVIELATNLKKERARRREVEQTNNILMHVNKTYTATEIAKEIGFKSAIALNNSLAEKGIQFKQNNTWVLYSKFADCGYVEIKQEVLDNGKIIYHRRFTQLGREFILKLFDKVDKVV